MAPAHVISTGSDSCVVELAGRRLRVSTLLLAEEGLAPGDWLVVAGASAVRRLDPDQALEVRRAIQLIDPTPLPKEADI